MIISLTDKYSLTLPGKFQSYIKTGKPLLGILNGEARELIKEFDIGCVAEPSDIEEIISAFRKMRDVCESGQSVDFGERAKRLSKSMFDRDKLISQLWKSN